MFLPVTMELLAGFGETVKVFVLTLVFILKPMRKGKCLDHVPWYDIVFAVLSAASCIYVTTIYDIIVYQPLQWISAIDKVFAVILVVLILEASRRSPAAVTIVKHGEKEQPLIAVYNRCLADAMLEEITQRKGSVFAFINKSGYAVYESALPADAFSNVNIPEEYHRISW